MHEETLNMILASTCPQSEDYDGYKVYVYDLCCMQAVIVAKCVSTDPYKFDIKSYKIINSWESPWDSEEVKQLTQHS